MAENAIATKMTKNATVVIRAATDSVPTGDDDDDDDDEKICEISIHPLFFPPSNKRSRNKRNKQRNTNENRSKMHNS